jgi:hypothetical protein
VAQLAGGLAEPAGFRAEAQERLHDRQGDQLSIAKSVLQNRRWAARLGGLLLGESLEPLPLLVGIRNG